MRFLPGHGCEYGLDWAISAILREELTPVDTASAFEESVRSCYPEEIHVGWMSFDAVSVMKEMDPISWGAAMTEWIDRNLQEEEYILIDDRYYSVIDVEWTLSKRC